MLCSANCPAQTISKDESKCGSKVHFLPQGAVAGGSIGVQQQRVQGAEWGSSKDFSVTPIFNGTACEHALYWGNQGLYIWNLESMKGFFLRWSFIVWGLRYWGYLMCKERHSRRLNLWFFFLDRLWVGLSRSGREKEAHQEKGAPHFVSGSGKLSGHGRLQPK